LTRSALIDARVVRHGRVRFVAVCAGSGARERCEETTTRGTDCLKELELAARAGRILFGLRSIIAVQRRARKIEGDARRDARAWDDD